MCLYPKLIKNRKYIANKKNGGNIPPVNDERVLYVPVGCGKCIECLKQKAREWQIRMSEEIRVNKNGKFVTLTFSEESLIKLREQIDDKINLKINKGEQYSIENEIATRAVRLFLERWRKKFKKSVRHWLVTELGHNGTERIHLHGIIFTDETKEVIEERWGYGIIWVGEYVNERTINYIIKYVNKMDLDHKGYKPKVLASPGLGANYMNRTDWKINKYKGEETKETYIYKNGTKAALPIYYRNKIYNEEEREKLWLHKLDKEERWVCGEKIDISKDEKEYYNLLGYYRILNKRLGYGDDTKEWNQYDYNKKRKKLKKYIAANKNKRIDETNPLIDLVNTSVSEAESVSRVESTDWIRQRCMTDLESGFMGETPHAPVK